MKYDEAKILQTYLRRLTNLNGSSRSLQLLRLSKWQDIDFQQFDFLLNKSAFDVLRPLLEGKTTTSLCAVTDPRSASNNTTSLRLQNISRKAKQIEEESGTQDLYVAYPFVEGSLANGQVLRCPLLYFPVNLNKKENEWQLSRREGELVVFNKSFLLAYSFFSQQPVAENLLAFAGENLPEDARVFHTEIYNLLKDNNLNINFNRELFEDHLKPFPDYLKKDFEDTHKAVGLLQLQPQAVLGLFPQADSYLVPDYQQLIDQEISIESLFAGATQETHRSPESLREEQLFAPFALDASQEQALRLLKTGTSLVVQGPPGTGKSELICNVIADAIARGKKVLLISQKRAALDVVYKRLASKQIQHFVALIHDFQADRPQLYQQLAEQIANTENYKKANSSLNAIALEQQFTQTARRIDQHLQPLEIYKKALFSTQEAGISAKTLYLTSSPALPCPNLSETYKYFRTDEWQAFQQRFKHYTSYTQKLKSVDNLWQNRLNYAHFSYNDVAILCQTIDEVAMQKNHFKQFFDNFSSVNQWFTQKKSIEELLSLLENAVVFDLWNIAVKSRTSLSTMWKTCETFLAQWPKNGFLQHPKERENDTQISENEWNNLLEKAQKAAKAHQNTFERWRWQLFSPDKAEIEMLLQYNNLKINDLPEKIEEKIRQQTALKKLKTNKLLSGLPNTLDRENILVYLVQVELAIKAAHLWKTMNFVHKNKHLSTNSVENFRNIVQNLLKTACFYVDKYVSWSKYLHEKQIDDLLMGEILPNLEQWKSYYRSNFDDLVAFDKLKNSLSTPETQVIHELETYLHTNPQIYPHFNTTWPLLDNAWRLAWITHLENIYPELRLPSSLQMDLTISELQEAVTQKHLLTADILPLRARERTYKILNYNRLGNQVSYRELLHQVSKKRKIWPLRRLLQMHADEIFELCPCWLASPETVSAVFPMEKIFDLVIFDEASQCFAEKGLPAVYRGKQILVVGDDKQLQPNNLYQIRWDTADDDTPLTELDSLLHLALQFLPQRQLLGHYRSRTPDLIEFSNRHFYRSSLQVLPHLDDLNGREPAIKFLKVSGLWENQRNEIEAREVVSLLLKLQKEQPDKSVGVVTFNTAQQTLILDYWEEALADARHIAPPNWFVKNIENVQGDERDIIIFSVGYAPNQQGKIAAQFGSLNMQGGENRLNVAITRAREEVWVICSFWPQQLDTENTQNEGPKLFKSYLEYALEVSEGRWKPQQYASTESAQYAQLAILLQQQNPNWQATLPFADLTEMQNSRYQSLILTDDNLFYQSLSAKDWFVYKPQAFSRQAWPFSFQHSRVFWQGSQ